MLKTRIVKKGNSQAILIPQELETSEAEYCISKFDEVYVVYPVNDKWAPTRQVIGTFSNDFMEERNQPSIDSIEKREDF